MSLVIAPHSDDAEISLGGYIKRQTSAGHKFRIVVLASGNYASTKTHQNVTSYMRQTEGQAAGEILGVSSYEFLEVAPDSNFGGIPRGDLVRVMESEIFSQEWDELFIPLPSFHTDHRVTYDACISATRPHLNRTLPKNIYAYEYPGQAWGPPAPTSGRVYARLDRSHITAKIEALQCHKSQWAADPDSLYGPRGVQALAELRGAEIGAEAAEMFYAMRTEI